MLTACTGKNEIVLEPGIQAHGTGHDTGTEGVSDMEETPEAGKTFGAAGQNPDTGKTDGAAGQNPNAEAAKVPGDGTENTVVGNTVTEEAALPDIYVHICGAVREPGVYVLATGSRVYEGVEAAGGFAEDACEDFVNQAGILADGQRLVIPTEEEARTLKADGFYQEMWTAEIQGSAEGTGNASSVGTVPAKGNSGGLVNINTASESELGGIPGIGAGKAAAIVKYRQENGAFASIEDIMKVSGIKEGTFEKIKDKITVN